MPVTTGTVVVAATDVGTYYVDHGDPCTGLGGSGGRRCGRHGSSYEIPQDGTASELFAGEVVVDRRTFAQHASAKCSYRLQ